MYSILAILGRIDVETWKKESYQSYRDSPFYIQKMDFQTFVSIISSNGSGAISFLVLILSSVWIVSKGLNYRSLVAAIGLLGEEENKTRTISVKKEGDKHFKSLDFDYGKSLDDLKEIMSQKLGIDKEYFDFLEDKNGNLTLIEEVDEKHLPNGAFLVACKK